MPLKPEPTITLLYCHICSLLFEGRYYLFVGMYFMDDKYPYVWKYCQQNRDWASRWLAAYRILFNEENLMKLSEVLSLSPSASPFHSLALALCLSVCLFSSLLSLSLSLALSLSFSLSLSLFFFFFVGLGLGYPLIHFP